MNFELLQKVPFFVENFSLSFIEKLSINFEERIFSDGDIIIKVILLLIILFSIKKLKKENDDKDKNAIYIIFKG